MQIMHRTGTEGWKQAGRVTGSKYMCDAAGTGTKAD